MFTKTTTAVCTALVLLVGTASSVLAAPKTYSTNPAYDVFDSRGKYVGADPDTLVRAMLRRDHAFY